MPVSPDNFEWIRRFIEDSTGNLLDADKCWLAETRLTPLVESDGLVSVDDLVQRLQRADHPQLMQQCIDAMLNHESSFFRDPHYFQALAADILPELFERNQNRRHLTIWSAACAAGQEACSLAILLREQFPEQCRGWQIELIATDVASSMIEQARDGRFSSVEIRRGLSDLRRQSWFRESDHAWIADASLRQQIRFAPLNLMDDHAPVQQADLILLRNVLIYMTPPTRQRVLQMIRQSLAPHGRLLLGATESLFGLDVDLELKTAAVPVYGIPLP